MLRLLLDTLFKGFLCIASMETLTSCMQLIDPRHHAHAQQDNPLCLLEKVIKALQQGYVKLFRFPVSAGFFCGYGGLGPPTLY